MQITVANTQQALYLEHALIPRGPLIKPASSAGLSTVPSMVQKDISARVRQGQIP
jgi:hypothetical protein